MIIALLVFWVLLGLLNFYVMRRADQAEEKNPLRIASWFKSGECYWVKNFEVQALSVSLFSGFFCLPFTILAAYDWYKCTRGVN